MNPEEMAGTIRARLAPSVEGSPPGGNATARVPDHDLVRQVGRGNYGEVWLAKSVTGQFRAVKVVWRRNFSSDRPYEREFRGIVQFEPISRSHPGLVNVLHVGRDDAAGFFYYMMELADDAKRDGNNLDEYIPRTLAADIRSSGRLPFTDVLQAGVRIADALGHLHRNGLVHRDIKPSNIIFIANQPKLADIGSVAGMDEALSFVGTEGFIPPEGPGSERADIFSLGRLLYEAATGKDRCDFPELPDDLDRWPAPKRDGLLELNEVLTRACAPNPSERHANAAELARELNLLLAGRSVRKAYGIERRLRHAKWTSSVAVALGIMAMCSAWFLRWQKEQADARAEREGALRMRAEAAENQARQQLYTALLEQARATVRSGEMGHRVQALDAIRRAGVISNTAALRGEAFAALALPDLKFDRDVLFGTNELGHSFDPSFERFAVGRGRGPVEVRAASDGRLLASLPPARPFEAHVMLWSPNGRFLAVKRDLSPGGARGDLEVWDLVTTQRIVHATNQVTAEAITFHPQRPEVLAMPADGTLRGYDLETGRMVRELNLAVDSYMMRLAPDGKRLAVSYESAGVPGVALYDVESGAVLATHRPPDSVYHLEWHPKELWLAAAHVSGTVRLIDPATFEGRILGQHKLQAVQAAFTPDGNFLISGGWERELICWDLRGFRRAFTIGINSYHVQFRNDGRQCAVRARDRAKIYDFEAPACHRRLDAELGRGVSFGAFSPDGRQFAATGEQSIGLWSTHEEEPVLTIPRAGAWMPFFSPTGSELFGYADNVLRRWQILPAEEQGPVQLWELPVPASRGLRQAGFTSGQLVMTSLDGTRIMPAEDLEEPWVHIEKARGWGAVSANGRWLAVHGAASPLLRVYSLPAAQQQAMVLTNRGNVWGFAFSPRGEELAVTTRAGLEFYDTQTWQRTRELANPGERESRIIFSPDGKTFWFTSDVRTSALRDSRTLEVLLPLPAGMLPLALSPDGRHLAVSVERRHIQIWDLIALNEQFRSLGIDG